MREFPTRRKKGLVETTFFPLMGSHFIWPRGDPHFYPVRMDDDGVPVFSQGQVDVFGEPGLWVYFFFH